MKSALAEYFGKTRRQKGLKVVDLARLIGFSNTNKGCRRIMAFEDTGEDETGLIPRIADALEISEPVIRELEELDRRAYQAWLSEPVQPYIVVRWLSAFYSSFDLPDGIPLEEAEKTASETARTQQKRCCLVWNRRRSIYYTEDGTIERISEESPMMTIGGRQLPKGGLRFREDKKGSL